MRKKKDEGKSLAYGIVMIGRLWKLVFGIWILRSKPSLKSEKDFLRSCGIFDVQAGLEVSEYSLSPEVETVISAAISMN